MSDNGDWIGGNGGWSPERDRGWSPERSRGWSPERSRGWSPERDPYSEAEDTRDYLNLSPSRSPARDSSLIGMGINPGEWSREQAGPSWEREQLPESEDEWFSIYEEAKREREAFEPIEEEIMELIQRLRMKDQEYVRQHDSGEYEDHEEVEQYDGGEYDGGQGDGHGGGDGGNHVAHDGYSNDSDEDDNNNDGDADARELREARETFVYVLNERAKRMLAEEARAERIEELAKDPAKGGRVDDKTRREAEVALQLEEMGLLAGPIRRDPSGDAEFIDRRGTLWDIKQFHSENGWFDLREAVKTIRGEILAGENVILDTKFLDANDAAALRSVIEANGWQRKILWSKDE